MGRVRRGPPSTGRGKAERTGTDPIGTNYWQLYHAGPVRRPSSPRPFRARRVEPGSFVWGYDGGGGVESGGSADGAPEGRGAVAVGGMTQGGSRGGPPRGKAGRGGKEAKPGG